MSAPSLRQIASNLTVVHVSGVDYFFSYETCVAFEGDNGIVVSENVWSQTTGKHLNTIDPDKKARIPYPQFLIRLKEVADAPAA